MSSRLHEHFKTNPKELDRVATPSAKTTPRGSPIPEELEDSIIQSDEEEADLNQGLSSPENQDEETLYSCLKVAVDTVQKNSPRKEVEDGDGDDVADETDGIAENEEEEIGMPPSRPLR